MLRPNMSHDILPKDCLKMRELKVSLGERSYPIQIGHGLLARPDLILHYLTTPRAMVVTNETVGPLYLRPFLLKLSEAGVSVCSTVLPDGESFKTWESLNKIFDCLMENRCDRTTTIIALGGGVIGDLAGFAAATYQRGVPYIQIPTTLLSQVDSSVGGKTAINHPRGKNMVGAFWQPVLVLSDTGVLNTLPSREISAGLSEIIKYGLIRDLPFFDWLELNIEKLRCGDEEALSYAIERSCINKAEVVAGDERETAKYGGRALLNLGHTFGHAIEAGLGFGKWLHGEAVGAGIVMATELSMRLGWLSRTDTQRIKDVLLRAGLPVVAPPLGVDRYIQLMSHDKKVVAGKMRLVLLREIGEAVTCENAETDMLREAIEACCGN